MDSETPATAVTFKTGDIVWAKLKGYPDWPALIMDPSEVPENVAAAMPKAHKDLIDPPENTVVQFFGSRDFGWVSSQAMRPFAEYYDRLYNPSVKRKYYQAGVKLALDPVLRATDQEAFEKEQVEKAEKEALKAAAKAQRREIAAAKKLARKADTEADEYSGEAPRTTKKLKLNTRGAETPSNGSPSRAPHEVPTVSSPITAVDKDKMELDRLLRLRVGLQKFLQKEGSRTPEDHLKAHERLTETESFPVNYEMFKKTKIGKVVKLISKMTGLESDPHEIIQRAQALMGKWRSILEGGVTPTADNNGPLSAVPGETPKLPSEHIQTVAPEDVTLPPSVPASQEEASSSAAAPSVTPMEVDVSASTAVATETVTSLVNDIVDFATSSCTSTVIPEPLTATSIETPPTITITAAHPLSSTDAEKQIPSPSTENLNSPAFMAHFNELNQTLRAEDKTLTVPEIGSDMLDSLMNNGVQNGETGAVKKDVKVEGGDDDAEESGMTLKAEEAIV